MMRSSFSRIAIITSFLPPQERQPAAYIGRLNPLYAIIIAPRSVDLLFQSCLQSQNHTEK